MARLLLSPKTRQRHNHAYALKPPRSSTRIAAVWEKVDPPAATKCLAPLMMPSPVAAFRTIVRSSEGGRSQERCSEGAKQSAGPAAVGRDGGRNINGKGVVGKGVVPAGKEVAT